MIWILNRDTMMTPRIGELITETDEFNPLFLTPIGHFNIGQNQRSEPGILQNNNPVLQHSRWLTEENGHQKNYNSSKL